MIAPLVSLTLFLFLHLLIGGVFRRKSFVLILAASAISWVVTFFGLVPWTGFWYSLSTHLFLLMLYLHWYVGVDRSVSIRILNELLKQPGFQISLRELEKIYPHTEMFEHRVQLMVQHGWIIEEAGQLKASPKAMRLVHPTNLFRKVYDLKETW